MRGSTTLLRALEDREPVGLESLVNRAALLTRVDRKYLLSLDAAAAAVAQAPAGTRVLDIAGFRTFRYQSTCLDTPRLDSFLGSARGRRRRFKVRTRCYLDTAGRYLEVKTRGPRGTSVKERVEHAGPPALTGSAHDFVRDRLTDAGLAAVDVAALAPVLTTTYRRATLLLPPARYGSVPGRVTVDTELAWASLRDGGGGLAWDDVVVETKAGSTPTAVDRWLWSRGHRPLRISKYGVGMTALHPGLPGTRWRRTLRDRSGPAHRTPAPTPSARKDPS